MLDDLEVSEEVYLTYILFDDRNKALTNISQSLTRLKEKIAKTIGGIRVEAIQSGKDPETKLICTLQGIQVKIEVNTIMRGIIKPSEVRSLSVTAQQEFDRFVETKVLSESEIFGGKICAALDRQHPRDLFDIYQLFNYGGITEEIKDGFIASLLSHNRPIHEMLNPNFQEQKGIFINQFQGMTLKPFTYNDYESSRTRLVAEINAILTENDKKLLLGFKAGKPDWSLSTIEKLKELPAVKWKLQNILKLQSCDMKKHSMMLKKLEVTLTN